MVWAVFCRIALTAAVVSGTTGSQPSPSTLLADETYSASEEGITALFASLHEGGNQGT